MRRSIALAALVCLAVSEPLFAQADRPRQWLAALSLLSDSRARSQNARQADLAILRQRVADWLALNPDIAVALPIAPPTPWSDDQVEQQIAALRQTIAQIAESDPAQPFYLGVTTVNVTAAVATLSPVTDVSTASRFRITRRSR